MDEKSLDEIPKKKRTPRVWHVQQEIILKSWGEASSCYRYMHNQAFQVYKKMSMNITIPIIIISTVTGTANFAQKTFPASWSFIPSIIGAFNLVAAIATTILQFLKVNELMESHRITSIQYGKLARNIRLELSMPLTERKHDGYNMVEFCKSEYDRLIEQSPPLPKKILAHFETNMLQIPSSNTFSRPEILSVTPIEIFNTRIRKRRNSFSGSSSSSLMSPRSRFIQEFDFIPSHPADVRVELDTREGQQEEY